MAAVSAVIMEGFVSFLGFENKSKWMETRNAVSHVAFIPKLKCFENSFHVLHLGSKYQYLNGEGLLQ